LDQQKGLDYLRRAADHGLAAAQYQLDTIYHQGELTPPDNSKAVEYMRRAADQNGPRAQYQLALLYMNGSAAPRSDADSIIALLRKSSSQGYCPASRELAEHYRTGRGVNMDFMQAIQYYSLAQINYAMSGNEGPNYDGIDSMLDGMEPLKGITPELSAFAKVLSCYRKATELNDPAAMRQIGDWYASGHYMPKDAARAEMWHRAAQGNEKAREEILGIPVK
jgi:hypothetical protein